MGAAPPRACLHTDTDRPVYLCVETRDSREVDGISEQISRVLVGGGCVGVYVCVCVCV